MRLISRVFKHEHDTRGMSREARLAYHQEHSKPLMDELERYMSALITERRVLSTRTGHCV